MTIGLPASAINLTEHEVWKVSPEACFQNRCLEWGLAYKATRILLYVQTDIPTIPTCAWSIGLGAVGTKITHEHRNPSVINIATHEYTIIHCELESLHPLFILWGVTMSKHCNPWVSIPTRDGPIMVSVSAVLPYWHYFTVSAVS